ncbi:MAG: VWA domain-containing protein, partial [Myxococcales bacterium]|nr:VWA domain-containing protein [Myxococcales bacterium]
IELFLRDLGPYDMPVGGTSIGRALIAGKRLLLRADAGADEGVSTGAPERERVIILFTDGEDHEGDPLEAATELANAGIRVYTVGIGSPTGEPIPTLAPDGTWTGYLRDSDGNVIQTALSPEGEATLGKIASTTGGKYFRAGKGAVGVDAIRREIARMKQTEKEAQKVVVHEERYVLALLPAFLLLFLEGLLPEAHFRRRRRA